MPENFILGTSYTVIAVLPGWGKKENMEMMIGLLFLLYVILKLSQINAYNRFIRYQRDFYYPIWKRANSPEILCPNGCWTIFSSNVWSCMFRSLQIDPQLYRLDGKANHLFKKFTRWRTWANYYALSSFPALAMGKFFVE